MTTTRLEGLLSFALNHGLTAKLTDHGIIVDLTDRGWTHTLITSERQLLCILGYRSSAA